MVSVCFEASWKRDTALVVRIRFDLAVTALVVGKLALMFL